MKTSLLRQFEGGLLGSAIAFNFQNNPPTVAPWIAIQDCAIATLIETGKLASQDWLKQIKDCDRSLLERQKTGTSSEIALTLLPAILFFHDLPAHLNAELTRTASLWLHPEESLEEILLWGEAIAFILRGQIKTSQFWCEQFLPDLACHHPIFSSLLNSLQDAIERGLSLNQTARMLSDRRLSQREIALALYCLSWTPEDFSLCWHRAKQLALSAPLAAILTGAIAGLYNSPVGFPPSWRIFPQSQQILEKARLLFSAWSGCYALDRSDRLSQIAIGAAGTIQLRKGFATISQRQTLTRSHLPK